MLLAVAALLLQPLAVPQNLITPVATLASDARSASPSMTAAPAAAPAESPANSSLGPNPAGSSPAGPLLIPEFDTAGEALTFAPGRTTPQLLAPTAMVTVIVVPVPADSPDPVPVEIAAVRPRNTPQYTAQQRRIWLGLSLAQHSAATFDAWSTRRAIASGAGRELNPMLKQFAGNASLYAAIQVGPVLLDYVGRRMMTSEHAWVRHIWWLPQTLGMSMSLASGVNNLGVYAAH